jgi:hypothetical protein
MSMPIDNDIKIFVSGVLGESSVANMFEEMAAIAAVLERQRKARGFDTWKKFSTEDTTFAYGFDCERSRLVMRTPDENIATTEPIATAYKAVQYVLNGGTDYSKGAYFWDGYDFKTNTKHFRRRQGFKYGNASDNIFNVSENKITQKKIAVVVENEKKTKKEVSADSIWESTTAISGTYEKMAFKNEKDKNGKPHKVKVTKTITTGTIFWKINPDFVKYFRGGKDYI